MGNMQGSHEISVEEQEMFEMQVDEDYNPKKPQSYEQAKLEFLARQQKRDAEEYRKKYLAVDSNSKIGASQLGAKQSDLSKNVNNIRNSVVVNHKKNSDSKQRGRVTYVFQELGHPDNPGPPNQEAAKERGNGQNQEIQEENVQVEIKAPPHAAVQNIDADNKEAPKNNNAAEGQP